MNRRDFIQTSSLSAATLTLPRFAIADELPFNPTPANGWRTFEVTTRVTPAADPVYGPVIPYLMYPQGEAGGKRLDSLDPQTFAYTITSKEITG